MTFIHGNHVDWVSAGWGSALHHRPTASQLHTKSTQCLWVALGLFWWYFFPSEKNGSNLQWSKTLTLNIFKRIVLYLWQKLFALFFELRSAISLIRPVLFWQCWTAMRSEFTGERMPGSCMMIPSVLFFPHSGHELGYALSLPAGIWFS